jgi:3-oxoacyl-[acyl-carrier protein] reductase
MGVVSFTRALLATLRDDAITLNAVLLSLTRTPMVERVTEPIVTTASGGRSSTHRMAEPEDVAGAILMLASDDAGWTVELVLAA